MGSSTTSWPARAGLAVLLAGYVMIDLVAAVPASPIVPRLPPGLSAPAWAVRGAEAIGLDRLSHAQLTRLSLGLLVVLGGAFLVVANEARRRRVRLGWVVAAAAAALTLLVVAPPLLSRDVYSYAAYGRIFALHGANPYAVPPSAFPHDPFTPLVSEEWIHTRSLYGPLFTLVAGGVTRTWSGSLAGTVMAFKAIAGVAAGLAAWGAASACRRVRPDRQALAVALVGLNPVIVVYTVGGGHNDALIAAFLAAALWVALRSVTAASPRPEGERLIVTALIALAVLVKVVAVLALAVWVWSVVRTAAPGSRIRSGALHAAVAVAVAAALAAPFLSGAHGLTSMAKLASVEGGASGARFVARGAMVLGKAVGGAGLGRVLSQAVFGAFLAFFAFLLWRLARRTGPADAADAWGGGMLAFALSAPYLLPWYVAWFVPFLALMADDGLAAVGVAMGSILALIDVPTEPLPSPALYRDMLLFVHYVVAPAMLALFVVASRRILRATAGRSAAPARPPGPAASLP